MAGYWFRLHRSPTDWLARGLLVLGLMFLGYLSITYTLAEVIRKAEPERAHTLAPQNGWIAARLAGKLLEGDASSADRAEANQLARFALRREPTAVPAVVALGLNAISRGDLASARRLFEYSQKLSRRDLATQIWALEDAVARNDIDEALRHYDIALRTSSSARDLLFPVLASAISDPAIRNALVKTLAGKPAWADSFVNSLVDQGPEPQATAILFRQLVKAGFLLSDGAEAALVNLLLSKNLSGEAWDYYVGRHSGAVRIKSRNPQFSAATDHPWPFDWVPANNDGITTSIRDGFDFTVLTGAGGVLLSQAQMLPPGEYRLTGRSEGIDQSKEARPYWVLNCRDGRELGRITLPNSMEENGRFAGQFSVPAECMVQTLALIVPPSEGVTGLSGRIDYALLSPAS